MRGISYQVYYNRFEVDRQQFAFDCLCLQFGVIYKDSNQSQFITISLQAVYVW